MTAWLNNILEDIWYGRHPASVGLAPLGWCFRGVVGAWRLAYRTGLLDVYQTPVPVIVVGNLTVGGTGKTPLVIWLAGHLKSCGVKPGIVARGYGGSARTWPQQVRPDSDPAVVGDEAIMISRRTGCPVAVGPDRGACVDALLKHADCDLMISDDGLQHHALGRSIEIVVIDGIRRFGNGRCLPAGPLREPARRLQEVDLIVCNGIAGRGEFSMKYVACDAYSIRQPRERRALASFEGKEVHTLAGIGNPERFFSLVKSAGIGVHPHPFPDHHRYRRKDLEFDDGLPVLVTEKDAVKCESIAPDNCWFVPITAELPEVFGHRLATLLARAQRGQKTT